MTTKMIIMVSGVAGCLGLLLLLERPSPVTKNFRLPQPSATVAASHPWPSATPSDKDDTDSPVEELQLQRRLSQADLDLRTTLRAQIRTVMESAGPTNEDLVSTLLAQWIQRDPAGAGRFAKSLPSGRWREMVVRRVAQDWAIQDRAGAERWAARLPDAVESSSAVADVCFQVAQTDARQAVEIAERHGLGVGPGATLENMVQQWAGQDAAGAAAWINEQPAGEQRDQMVGRLAYVQSQTEPAAAANLVVEQIPTGPIQDEAAITVLHQWALRDPASAAVWVDRFPPGALRDRARAELQGLAEYALKTSP